MPALERSGPATGRPLTRRHRGQAIIEMAIVATLMMVLAVGIVDFGVYMYKYVQAANCVREAARRAVVRDPNAESPPYCVDAGLAPDVTPNNWVTLPTGEQVTARIDTTYSWLGLKFLIPFLPSTLPLRAQTSMRMEGQVA